MTKVQGRHTQMKSELLLYEGKQEKNSRAESLKKLKSEQELECDAEKSK